MKSKAYSKIFCCFNINFSYLQLINDTVASLTNQEVTEMEVQVDPMVFLEDDQMEDCEQGETDDTGYGC